MKPRPLDPYLAKLFAWIKRNWRALGGEDPAAGLRRSLRIKSEIEQTKARMARR